MNAPPEFIRAEHHVNPPIGTILRCEDGYDHVFVGWRLNNAGREMVFVKAYRAWAYQGPWNGLEPFVYHASGLETLLRKFPGLAEFTLEKLALLKEAPLRIGDIKTVVAEHFEITVRDLEGPCHNDRTATPRQICYRLCAERTLHSYPAIGRNFGGRDHSTVMKGIASLKQKLVTKPELKDAFDAISLKLDQLVAANSNEGVMVG